MRQLKAVFGAICKIGLCGLCLLGHSAWAQELKPFSSDGCSSFPDGTLRQQQLWLSCCIVHDNAYWLGGTYEQRLEADKALRQCVSDIGEPAIGLIMLAGVRVGGSPLFPTQFRWGYGWDYPRFYGPHTKAEKKAIHAMTQKSLLGPLSP